ncbi:hypothetical protein B7760_06086 (plasmid) [Burkholderia glumae]|nr:hypothetical protein B7760_06086 [Burkholderia glumae]
MKHYVHPARKRGSIDSRSWSRRSRDAEVSYMPQKRQMYRREQTCWYERGRRVCS